LVGVTKICNHDWRTEVFVAGNVVYRASGANAPEPPQKTQSLQSAEALTARLRRTTTMAVNPASINA